MNVVFIVVAVNTTTMISTKNLVFIKSLVFIKVLRDFKHIISRVNIIKAYNFVFKRLTLASVTSATPPMESFEYIEAAGLQKMVISSRKSSTQRILGRRVCIYISFYTYNFLYTVLYTLFLTF